MNPSGLPRAVLQHRTDLLHENLTLAIQLLENKLAREVHDAGMDPTSHRKDKAEAGKAKEAGKEGRVKAEALPADVSGMVYLKSTSPFFRVIGQPIFMQVSADRMVFGPSCVCVRALCVVSTSHRQVTSKCIEDLMALVSMHVSGNLSKERTKAEPLSVQCGLLDRMLRFLELCVRLRGDQIQRFFEEADPLVHPTCACRAVPSFFDRCAPSPPQCVPILVYVVSKRALCAAGVVQLYRHIHSLP